MIKHIVMMKLKASAEAETHKEKLAAMLQDLEAKIPQIRWWEVGSDQ